MKEPLVEKEYLLQKFDGKGGWTFIEIPEIQPDKHSHFGWVKVRGFIDHYELPHYPLQPMGNGRLFLPIKAEIRKQIKKQAGDTVKVILYSDDVNSKITEELKICLKEVSGAYEKFSQLPENQQKAYIEWISASKRDEIKIQRIITVIDKISIL
ncbi:MAG: YdeI/OmpD-associated family protein [Pedobacter sp.]|uniref:YdeI/OmpD-associated family protein n=1 Tax=Pedobacter sp. TaxID=1411316 RepID=UPI0028078201|nr:YdeI/OmpD-associated family protein [Pedobacter sp.]MDQ8003284.1 YdeI/OmpD-associated family protein [Pedobacter sp.]